MSVKREIRYARAALTRNCGELEKAINDNDLDKIRNLRGTLTAKHQRLEDLNKQLKNELESETDDSIVDSEYEKFEEYRDNYDLLFMKASTILDSTATSVVTPVVASCTSKLPKLVLPTFGGNVLEYNDFIKSFEISVDSTGLPDIQKFNYLKSLLKGDAANLIAGLELSDCNYDVAKTLLKNRYGSERRLKRSHIRSLLSIDCCHAKDATAYRSFVDSANKHIRGLESLGMKSEDYKDFLCEILIDHVPNRIKMEWAELSDDKMNLINLLKLIENEAKKFELVRNSTQYFDKSKSSMYNNSVTLYNSKINCLICNSNDHCVSDCPKFVEANVPQRYDMVKQYALCYNCLDKHRASNCMSKTRCKNCSRAHHDLLHYEKTLPNTSSNSVMVSENDKHLLPVCTIPFLSHDKVENYSALLDSGSQRSFVNANVLKNLKFRIVETSELLIKGFGGSRKEVCDTVELIVKLDDIEVQINVIATNIFNDINVGDQSSCSNLLPKHNLKSVEIISPISLVIGADYYYKFVTGSSIKLSDRAYGLETIFGWTVHGFLDSESLNCFDKNLSKIDCIDNGSTVQLDFDANLPEIDIEKRWNNKLAGVFPVEDIVESEPLILKEFESSIYRNIDGQYAERLSFKSNAILNCSYKIELKPPSLSTVCKGLKQDDLKEYELILKDYIKLDNVK